MRSASVQAAVQDAVLPSPVASLLGRSSDLVDRACCAAAVAAMAAFAGVMLLGVYFRYVVNASLSWSDEVATILFGWSVFLFIASAYLNDQHVHVDTLVRRLKGRTAAWAAIAAQGIAAGYLAALLWSCIAAWEVVSRSHTDALQIPVTLHFSAIPVAACFMLLHWARRNASEKGIAAKLGVALIFFVAAVLPIGSVVAITGLAKAVTIAVALFVPLLLGVPVAIALGVAATLYMSLERDAALMTNALQAFNGANVFVLVAIPLLILSGKLMHDTGIARRLVEFSMTLVGRIRGGLGAANVLASFLFGDISGSAVSDTAAIGSLMIPEMKKRGYRADFCAALQGSAGTLGMTAPLSITVLLYAGATNSSVSRLAAAMLLPSLVLVGSFIAVVIWHARRHGYPAETAPAGVFFPRLFAAAPGLFALILVLAGILGGIFTPAEVGAILLAYVLLLGVAVYRTASPKVLYKSCVDAGHISGMTIFMVCTSGFLGFVLSRDMVSQHVAVFLGQVSTDRYFLLFVMSAVFLVLGMFLEPPAMIFGFLPTFLPLLVQANVDLIHWGVLLAINAGVGCILPPVALNLFVSTRLAGVSYGAAVRASVPFILIMLLDLAIVAVLPQISLLLPHLLFDHPMP